MEALRARRTAGEIPDVLLLVEHPPVLTLGRGARREHVLASASELEARGVELFETDRGGDVTYHGPGQVVGYPIVELPPGRRDVRRWVRDLEEAMILAAADHGVAAGRLEGMHGVWLGEGAEPETPGPSRKLGAIGVHLTRWVSTHGFAFNVTTRLEDFGLIVPCGISGRGVTSLAAELGRDPASDGVERSLARHLADVLDRRLEWVETDATFVQVQVVRRGKSGVELLALRRSPDRGGFWQPVTGHVEGGEQMPAAAARELREETGLDAAPVALGYRHSFLWDAGPMPVIAEERAFAVRAPPDFEPALDGREHVEARWIPPEEAVRIFPFAGLRRGAELARRWGDA